MTTTVERTYEVDAALEEVWEFIADPRLRAEAISVVNEFHTDGEEMIWKLALPVPGLPGTVSVRTRDVERDPPRHVRFIGQSRIMEVEGEHTLSAIDDGCRIYNRFDVTGRLPGVERFFKKNVDDEIDNLVTMVTARIAKTRDA